MVEVPGATSIEPTPADSNPALETAPLPSTAWRYQALPAVGGADYALTAALRIDESSAVTDPVVQGDKFSFYNNNEDLGGYEGALALRQRGGDLYRVMFSAAWQEVLLWSSRAGVLQVKPLPLELGRAYQVEARVVGAHLQLLVDGALVLDHWDRQVPLLQGGAALGQGGGGKVTFADAQVRALSGSAAVAPPYAPALQLRTWKGMRWGFDGDQPLFALGDDLIAYEMRLVRDYPAQLYMPWYVQNWSGDVFRCNQLESVRAEESGERLVLRINASAAGRGLRCETLVTVSGIGSGDPSRDYRYEFQTDLIVPQGERLGMAYAMDLTDPGFFNGVPSASAQGMRWAQWRDQGVYQHKSGAIYKVPLNHMNYYPGYRGQAWNDAQADAIKADGGFFAVAGDAIANPVFTIHETADKQGDFGGVFCGFAYDLHFNWAPGKSVGGELGPGRYRARWSLGNMAKRDTDAALQRAALAHLSDPSASWLLFTGGLGHAERFDRVVSQASVFSEYAWGVGALRDAQVGRGDSTSLRFAGPAFAGSAVGGAVFMEELKPDSDYEISAWVRTENAVGEGPGLHFAGQAYYPGLRGTSGWQRVGFRARTGSEVGTVPFALHHSGAGRVWFDDFLIRPVTEAQPIDPALDHGPRALAEVGGARPDRTLSWSAVTDGVLLDGSGHGHHGALRGPVGAAGDAEGGLLCAPSGDEAAYVEMPGHPSAALGDAATLSLWVRPQARCEDWNMIAAGGADKLPRWYLYFVCGDGGAHRLSAAVAGVEVLSALVLPEDRWSHLAVSYDGSVVRLYVNGALAGQAPGGGAWLGQGADGFLWLGAAPRGDVLSGAYRGRMGGVRVVPRALSAAEVAAVYGAGRAAP